MCDIPTDPRDLEGIPRMTGRLTSRLEDGEDPMLALFLRFFPMAVFEEKFAATNAAHLANTSNRRRVLWDKG